jgi:hypothetical protein
VSGPMPTPEEAYQAYRQLVEMNETAVPILLVCTTEDKIQIVPLAAGHPSEGLLVVKDDLLAGTMPELRWALLSAESTVRLFERGRTEPRTADAAVYTLVSRDTGHVFTAVKPFTRLNTGVLWQRTTVHTEPMDGLVTDLMLSLVR